MTTQQIWPGLSFDGNTLLAQNGSVSASPAIPMWQKFTIGYAALQTAGLTNNTLVYTLPIKGIISASFINVTSAFAGTLITSLLATVGTAGNNAKYFASSSLLSATEVNGLGQTSIGPESMTATTAINLYVTAIGANLSALTQGSVDIELLVSTAV